MAKVADLSRPWFDLAHAKGLMGVSFQNTADGKIEVGATGQRVVDYIRCGYLNLDAHPKVVAAARACLDATQAVHFSVARTRLSTDALVRLERQLASLFDVHGVVVFPSVAAANMGCLPLLAAGLFTGGRKPLVVFDRFAHVTLQYHIPVLREETDVVVIKHNDIDLLETLCRERSPVAYIADGAYSMGGLAPVREIRRLQEQYGLFAFLDDAHGISIMGRRGEGFVRSQLDGLGGLTLVAASLGKGFGAAGGLVMVGTPEQEQMIRRYAPTYAFSCQPDVAAVGAALGSAEVHATPELGQLQRRLQANLRLFDSLVTTESAGSPVPIRMFRIGAEEKAIERAEFLLRCGHLTSAVFFPTVPRGQAAIRMCLTAAHLPDDVAELATLLTKQNEETQSCESHSARLKNA
jgi:7-keto-8-aminopelargonate synthetase-like enzyme